MIDQSIAQNQIDSDDLIDCNRSIYCNESIESYLIDYDVHSNYGNWIYQSGVGNDPRDRKFNIKKQAEQYDPQQEFVKLWTE